MRRCPGGLRNRIDPRAGRDYKVARDYGNLKQSGIAPFAGGQYDFSGIYLIALAEAQPPS